MRLRFDPFRLFTGWLNQRQQDVLELTLSTQGRAELTSGGTFFSSSSARRQGRTSWRAWWRSDLLRDGKPPKGWLLERDRLLETRVPGIFVAGDVRHGSVKRVASGVGEGANGVQFVHQYLKTV